MPKLDYKAEYKAAKEQVAELQNQVVMLKDRMIELRKAKNQTVLKTAIINRSIFEPQFGHHGEQPVIPSIPPAKPEKKTVYRDAAVNTDPPPPPPLPPPPPKPVDEGKEVPVVRRSQRKRVKEGWSQCQIYTENKITQASFVQTCHCEGPGVPAAAPTAPPPTLAPPSPARSRATTPQQQEIRTLSRMRTKEYISADSHAAELATVEAAYRTEREKLQARHDKEVAGLKATVVELNEALAQALAEGASRSAHAGAGGVFHLYAEEKRRMEEQVRHINGENHKLRVKVKKLMEELQEKEDTMEEEIERVKEHTTQTWDEQYRSWMNKTEQKMSFLRQSNENMQSFLIKNARHLPFGATDELKIFNEYGEKVTVFQ